ncbi:MULTISPECIES: DEAD/DEAH box helicase [unclassified Bacteroides]|uniref:DEAD/DEAH box helicase n=1 Tax=unclassified Bacteroides TaxID=2646097 RepID=UPI0009DD260F|nr:MULTISPECIES: AAA domain-containing protein [unclassified Bacteroides]
MVIRLNNVLKKLNIGINAAAEFLQKKGVPIQDATPNVKITEKQYEMLVENFCADKNINVSKSFGLGTIDLNGQSIATRPQRKTKEERRERDERNNQRKSNGRKRVTSIESSNTLVAIRDIWQRFVDIQEKLIKLRCSPISIIPESIEVDNDKLYVTVDESRNEQQLDSILKGKLELDSYDLESGYILVDESKWNTLQETELEQVRKGLSECYVELDTTPAINVIINYGGDMERSDLLSIGELHQMDSILKDGNLVEGTIDDKATFISKVRIDLEGYIKYLFGEHYVTYEKKKKNQQESKIIELLEYHNQYIPWDVMQQYSHIGLNCKQYTLIFKINNPKAKEKLKDCYDCYSPNTDTFEFCRSFTKNNPCHKDYVIEVNDNIQAFMNEAMIYCSNDDIEIEILFGYSISKHQLVKSKFAEIGQYIRNKGVGCSFNDETGAIGIDFNWRTDNIDEILSEIESKNPFVKVNVHDEHRFKCSVNSQLVGYDSLKQVLEDKYDNIDIQNDSVYHQIKIRLPYLEPDYYELKRARLESDLLQLLVTGINVQFAEKIPGKIRLNVSYNKKSRLEDLQESITEMRRADFGFMLDDKELKFGKLLKANYPELVFDIDVSDDKKEHIIEAFESKAITTIIPVLTGELEKISRLKNTFTMAATGTELVNPRLQRFIFNSAEAVKTKDIDFLLRRDGVVYRDLCEHLLNSRVNEPQKKAIIKAMYAEDLAVIQGPPGTGKSTAIAEMIWQLVRKGLQQGNKRERILLTSETNLAVDNAISRIVNDKTNLVKPVRFGDEEKLESEGLQFSIELMKRWVEEGESCLIENEADEETHTTVQNNLILKNWLDNISARSFNRTNSNENNVSERWRNYLNHPSRALREIVYNRYIENVNVIGATCSSIGDRRAGNEEFNGFTLFFRNFCEVFKQKRGKARIEFTTVIQDESSKATPAELVLPFVYGQRAIVIGDHRQLPPMLDKEEFEETLDYAQKIAIDDNDRAEICKLRKFVDEHFEEMEVSHFENLYNNIDESLKGSFNFQYRMHPDINEVIEQFYRADGGLYCGLVKPIDLGVNDHDMSNPASRYHGIDIPGLIDHNTHVLFIDTNSPEMMDGTSRVNYGEIETVDKLLTKFEKSDSFHRYLGKFTKEEDKQIGIISFYGKQIKQLRMIAHSHSTLLTRVSTVDRFQGMERNIVIVSMVRSNTIQSSKNQQPDWKRYPDLGFPKQKSLGFAQSPNRLNVALSRAKRLLIIVGNRELFSSLEIYQRLFLTIDSNKNNKVLKQQEV